MGNRHTMPHYGRPRRGTTCGQPDSDRGQPGFNYNTERHPVVTSGARVDTARTCGQPDSDRGQPGFNYNTERHPVVTSGARVDTARTVAVFDVHHETTVGKWPQRLFYTEFMCIREV